MAVAEARQSEEDLAYKVADWHARGLEAMCGVLEALQTTARPPHFGLALVRPDLLAQVEARAAAASREAASAHLASLDEIVRAYELALVEFASTMSRLRSELSRAEPSEASAEVPAAGDDTALWQVVAALDARMMAYEGDCSLLAHVVSSVQASMHASECQSLLAGLRVSPFLNEPFAKAARSLLRVHAESEMERR